LAELQARLKAYAEPMNPHPFMGMGGPDDILTAARGAVRRKVVELIESYTCGRTSPVSLNRTNS
jgi:hypothetical protein